MLSPDRDNLARVYTGIAGTMPQAIISWQPNVIASVGPFAHPICNFAIVLDSSGIDLALELASGRPHFNIYTFDSSLSIPGFRIVQDMAMMRAVGTPSDEPALLAIDSPRERLELGRFMAGQFFAGQKSDLRERLAEATSLASGTEMYGFSAPGDGKLVGGAVMHETAHVIGLFNICVDAPWRRRGWGAYIVTRLLGECHARNKPAVLQAERSLVPWYRKLRFKEVDSLAVWSAHGM